MASRLLLHKELKEVLGNNNVYFQPPESVKLKYPCIVYEFEGVVTKIADDVKYKKDNRYLVTLIHEDPDNTIKDVLLDKFKYCSFDTIFCKDNLNHYVFDLYY